MCADSGEFWLKPNDVLLKRMPISFLEGLAHQKRRTEARARGAAALQIGMFPPTRFTLAPHLETGYKPAREFPGRASANACVDHSPCPANGSRPLTRTLATTMEVRHRRVVGLVI